MGSQPGSDCDTVVRAGRDVVILQVLVQPKARRNQVVGVHAGRLKVAVTAPPDRGAANEAVMRLIAEELGVPRTTIRLIRGATSRRKDLELQDLDVDTARDRVRRIIQ